jgi:hypothetical protein
MVNEAVQAAAAKHLKNTQDVLVFVKNYLVQKANNFKCGDILSVDVSFIDIFICRCI